MNTYFIEGRRMEFRASTRSLLTVLVMILIQAVAVTAASRPNVLFLAIDDLRAGLSAREAVVSATPNLDRLAASGRSFTRHYTQVPTCGASRCALWRGRYPDKRSYLDNNAIKSTHEEWSNRSLPACMRDHGYRTLSLGKSTHYPGGRTGKLWAEGPEELPGVWDRCWIPDTPWGAAQNLMHGYANGTPRQPGKSPPVESFDGPDSAYPDAWIADEAIATLRQLKDSQSPWFFAVGFFKPHLPFAAPQKWFDATDPKTLPVAVVTNQPSGISSWHGSGEFRGNYGHGGRDPAEDPAYEQTVRHAYAAAARYMDAQLGRVLTALHDLDLSEETIVVAWGDHGFLLGEHSIWGKHCLYEKALQSPLIIRAPSVQQRGVPSESIVESVDVFPTILEVCGLSSPPGLSGTSLVPQLTDPAASTGKPAAGFWRNQRTLRTDRWRIIAHETAAGEIRNVELFDMREDPHESVNAASKHPEVVEELMAQLKQLPRPAAVVQ